MTVSTTASSVTYTGNGSATNWPFNFKVLAESDLVVKTLDTTTGVLTTLSSSAYTVNGVGNDAGGSVDYPLSGSPLASTMRIIIERVVAYTQPLDIVNQGGFFPNTLEEQLDLIVMQVQQIADMEERSLRLPVGDNVSDGELALDTTRAGKLLGFDANGDFAYTGFPSDIETYETRTALAAASVPASIGSIRTNGYAAEGDGGGALYKRVGVEPSHEWKVQSADGAWWELVPDAMGVNVKQLGAKGDNSTDDFTAFDNAINNGPDLNASGVNEAHHTVIVPGSASAYYIGSTLQPKKVVRIMGASSGLDNTPNPSKLRFDANTTGIIVHNLDTIGATTEGTGTGSAGGSTIQGLEILSDGGTIAGVTDGTKGHGIWLRARTNIIDVSTYNFPGHGIQILADSGGGASTKGNANGWFMSRVRATGNHQNGVYVNGADANAGEGQLVDASNNGRWGIEDDSFLGNTWTGCHESANGGDNTGENSGTSCIATFGGTAYILNVDASEADAVATQPGTDKSVWIESASATGGVAWSGGLPEGTYHHGGGYKGTSVNARSVFLGCYTEPGKGSQFKKPNLWLGGHESFDTFGQHGGFAPNVNYTRMRGTYRLDMTDAQWPIDPSRNVGLSLNPSNESMLNLQADSDGSFGLYLGEWEEGAKNYVMRHKDATNGEIQFTSTLTTNTYGRASAQKGVLVFPRGYFLGNFSDARFQSNATAAPTSGEHARGEIYWNRDQAQSGVAGWVCVSAGTPGTWAEIRGVGTQQSHIADPSGGSTVDTEARAAINSILAVIEHFGFTATS